MVRTVGAITVYPSSDLSNDDPSQRLARKLRKAHLAKTPRDRSAAYRASRNQEKKRADNAIRVARRQTRPRWVKQPPRHRRQSVKIGEKCHYYARGLKQEPRRWPQGVVRDINNCWVVIERLTFSRRAHYTAVPLGDAWAA